MFGLTVYRSDAGPVFAGSHRIHHNQSAALEFVEQAGRQAPIVSIKLSGDVAISALVDTTSRDNWTTLPAIIRLNGTAIGPPGFGRTADHVLDDIGGMLFVTSRLKLDTVDIANALFYARVAHGPLGSLARWVPEPDPAIVLGVAALRPFPLVQFDFAKGRLLLASSEVYEPAPERLIATLPLEEVQGALACDGVMEGKTARFLIDVAGDFEIAMKDPPTPKMRQISLGDLVVRQATTQSSFDLGLGLSDYPRIGRQILERFVVSIDFRGKRIHFERPAGR
jgi:hypothetical protein